MTELPHCSAGLVVSPALQLPSSSVLGGLAGVFDCSAQSFGGASSSSSGPGGGGTTITSNGGSSSTSTSGNGVAFASAPGGGELCDPEEHTR